jgi:hypothetical protein
MKQPHYIIIHDLLDSEILKPELDPGDLGAVLQS